MIFDLKLRDLPSPNLNEKILENPLKRLKEIAKANTNENAGETPQFRNRKQELIDRLKRRKRTREPFEQATDVVGRERLLLSIYLDYLGQPDAENWLPAFDNHVAKSILGSSGRDWHMGRRRQVTLLFFTHFDKIAALPFLCARLAEAYNAMESNDDQSVKTWCVHRGTIFHESGPEKISKQAITERVRLHQLMDRFAIPNKGRFAERLRQFVFLREMETVTFGHVTSVFEEIEQLKDEPVSPGFLLGAKALQIMVRRVAGEGRGKWHSKWSEWIVRFGCDPRLGRASAVGAKWWNWAEVSEFHLAKQGMIGLDLDFFIKFLENSLSGTGKEGQFRFRAGFLKSLFQAGKITEARLIVNQADFHKLDPKYRNATYGAAQLVKTTDQTSIICLHCKDDIHIIEGTHSFGLRVFRHKFPVPEFWDRPAKRYPDKKFRISHENCPIFIRHTHTGSWVRKFFYELRAVFHVEWNDVRIF